MESNWRFVGKVAFIHVLTYIVCGILFSYLLDYESLFQLDSIHAFMHSYDGNSVLIGPLVQVFRGLLFGLVLLIIKNVFHDKPYGWLRLWAVLLVIGVINTPGAAPGSIEGMIYTKLPWSYHFIMSPEVWLQTMLFSYFVAKPPKKTDSFFQLHKQSFMTTILAGVLFSLSGIVLSFILKVDVYTGTKDLGAFGVMFVALAIVFFSTKWYVNGPAPRKLKLLGILFYIALAILPTLYNYLVQSPFQTLYSLGINAVAVIILVLYLWKNRAPSLTSKSH